MTTVKADFEVTGWDDQPYPKPADGPALGRATVRKTFHGDVAGTSVAELLTARSEGGAGYVASEVFEGSILGRKGTIVFMHGGLDDQRAPYTFGNIVPDSGTGELAGMTGSLTFRHDASGAQITIELA